MRILAPLSQLQSMHGCSHDTWDCINCSIAYVSLCHSGTYVSPDQTQSARESCTGPYVLVLRASLAALHANYNYVTHRLKVDYSPTHGVFGLPEHAQAAVVDVAYYYQNLANMMNFGLLDKDAVLPMIQTRIVNLWGAIKPFVEVERQPQGSCRADLDAEVARDIC